MSTTAAIKIRGDQAAQVAPADAAAPKLVAPPAAEPKPAPRRELPADGWLRLADLYAAFGGDRFAAARWAKTTAAEAPHLVQRPAKARDWRVQVGARLPDGTTAGAAYMGVVSRPCADGVPLPRCWVELSPAEQDRVQEARELVAAFDLLKEKYPHTRGAELDSLGRVELSGRFARLGFAISARSIERLRRRTDGRFEESARPLDGRGRPAGAMDDEAWDQFCVEWLRESRPGVAAVYDLVAALAGKKGWRWPTLRAVQARVKRELPPALADYHRAGPRKWDAKHAPYIDRDLSHLRANATWVGDHRRLDVWARDSERVLRPWITSFADQRTRRIVGWVLVATPDSDSILAALRAGVLAHGAPETLYVDNGRDYRARAVTGGKRRAAELDDLRVESAAGRLGMKVIFAKAFRARSKSIERVFGTLAGRFDHLMPTYAGRSPEARPESVLRAMKDGEITPPTLGELREMLADAIGTYNVTPHGAADMDGLSPNDAFLTFDPIPRRTAPREVLNRLCDKMVRVKVSRNGVRVRGVTYSHFERLTPLQGESVLVRYSQAGGDKVEVFDNTGRFVCEARNLRLLGVTSEDIAEGERRRKAARKLAQKARPAALDALLDTPAHALRVMRERAERLARERRKVMGAPEPELVDRRVELIADAAREHENARLRVEAARRDARPRGAAPSAWEALAAIPAPEAEAPQVAVIDWAALADADNGGAA